MAEFNLWVAVPASLSRFLEALESSRERNPSEWDDVVTLLTQTIEGKVAKSLFKPGKIGDVTYELLSLYPEGLSEEQVSSILMRNADILPIGGWNWQAGEQLHRFPLRDFAYVFMPDVIEHSAEGAEGGEGGEVSTVAPSDNSGLTQVNLVWGQAERQFDNPPSVRGWPPGSADPKQRQRFHPEWIPRDNENAGVFDELKSTLDTLYSWISEGNAHPSETDKILAALCALSAMIEHNGIWNYAGIYAAEVIEEALEDAATDLLKQYFKKFLTTITLFVGSVIGKSVVDDI